MESIKYFQRIASLLSRILWRWLPSRYRVWNDAKLLRVLEVIRANSDSSVKVAVLQLYSALALCGNGAERLLENGENFIKMVVHWMDSTQPPFVRIEAFKLAQLLKMSEQRCSKMLRFCCEPIVQAIIGALREFNLLFEDITQDTISMAVEAGWEFGLIPYNWYQSLGLGLSGSNGRGSRKGVWNKKSDGTDFGLGVIRLTLSRSVAHNVVKEKTTTYLMKALSEIDFDDEIRALIVLASFQKLGGNRMARLPKRCRETSGSGSALNLETRGRVDSPLDDWVLDSELRFIPLHTEKSYRIMLGDFSKVYLADGSALDVVGLGDVRISLPNGLQRELGYWLWKEDWYSVYDLMSKRHNCSCYASTDTSLWHRRLGHMSEKGMKMLLSKGKLPELKTPKAEKLELVHTDLWGPSPVASLGGSRSGRPWLRQKQDGETIPGTPQQNGVAERMNRTLNERARSMRLHAGLPKTFWVMLLACSLPDKPMTISSHGVQLPEEVWSGKESKICFFISYGDEKFGYRFWDEQNRKIIRSRNVIFNEQVMYKDRGEEDKENVNSQVDLSTPVAEVRRSSRNIRPPQRYSPVLNYLLLTDGGEPECYDEALQDENSSKWELAMKDEMDSLLGNQTWELTELSVGKKALHNKWLDVKTTFLHGDLEEDLYMIEPEGFIVQGQENLVCKLRKSLVCIERINNLKKQLSKQFAMKDLGAAKQILAKPVSTPLGSHFKLSKEQSPKTEEERDHMSKVPYASAIGSLMYAMVCTRPDIAHEWELCKFETAGLCRCDFAGDIIVERVLLEDEYVAATEAGKEMIWLHGFLDELGKKQEMGILHSDS
ncbi:Retrovirus-related Pol polyprotein from transposon TNT 1-94 [Vitis vinifera]|uniref:Retrovirus-related Pol polyprotein from transposon TNT 1-94 n=1 Tax=Vitis vinifera TaxID=29760 RepID=A0A438J1S2_VITVI|nr:Retrovirus-related Pol polyprotein from transposon TNT 1-94 [Vitis vinifera]